ncbi:MAG: DUF86 domain-containing protein [Acidobacteria bacterium]|nr:DUF86 domain-containing protein [Acidobacteriota bacterium]
MRRELLFLQDIRDASDALAGFVAGQNEAAFSQNDLLRSAVVHKLTVIGEAASRLPDEIRQRHPEIPWRDVIAFRNILVHAYFGIQWDLVWKAATEEVPDLRKRIEAMLNAEFE